MCNCNCNKSSIKIPVGPQGPQGATGAQGPAGPQGEQGPPGESIPGGLIVASLVMPASPVGADEGIELDMPFSLMDGGNGKTLEIEMFSDILTSPATLEIFDVTNSTTKTLPISIPGTDTQYTIHVKVTMVKTASSTMVGFVTIHTLGVNDGLSNFTGAGTAWTSVTFGTVDPTYRFIFAGSAGNISGVVKLFNPIT